MLYHKHFNTDLHYESVRNAEDRRAVGSCGVDTQAIRGGIAVYSEIIYRREQRQLLLKMRTKCWTASKRRGPGLYISQATPS